MGTSELLLAGLISAGGALIILALLIVITTDRWNVLQTLIWALVVLAVPVIGAAVFLVVDHQQKAARRATHRDEAVTDASASN
ncbi:ABC-type nickel/cobalt efflux system permease component RcnA [Actinoalloteichus hoggarensis]|uniref:Cardiolipin synthase n=1 Tax=Actinoalloteichus hoggarensis TaxID=1470176 RepID=A0A221W8E3_9PSEU|nr:PLDc N-terminal domain-containing protein [Actinoalloteichus hoggarensis]ASO21941.1 Cardiolipin synthase [Actinoalloteichus hoggarensis]MBB5924511.1 ABC-type nickel/cobalt efflux system permease component RcnA [Actinoalloteichus hoggarensis]